MNVEDEVLRAVDALGDEAVAFAAEMVRIDVVPAGAGDQTLGAAGEPR